MTKVIQTDWVIDGLAFLGHLWKFWIGLMLVNSRWPLISKIKSLFHLVRTWLNRKTTADFRREKNVFWNCSENRQESFTETKKVVVFERTLVVAFSSDSETLLALSPLLRFLLQSEFFFVHVWLQVIISLMADLRAIAQPSENQFRYL